MDSKKDQDERENRSEDSIMGNWLISSTSRLIDFQTPRDSGLPLAFCLRSYNNLDCMFIDIFSQETSITNISDLGRTIIQEMNIMDTFELFDVRLLYSKGGWMLFRGPGSTGLFTARFFLLNIFSGERLHLPGYGTLRIPYNIVFSTSSSNVDYVAHVIRQERSGLTTLSMARPGDEVWEVHTKYNRHDLYCFDYNAVIISGRKVYCFDDGKTIDVFDLVERQWVTVTVLQAAAMNTCKFPVMEVDGVGLVKMLCPTADLNLYRFFRLEVNEYEHVAAWVEMSEQELENLSFFVGSTPPFCAKSLVREAAVYEFNHVHSESVQEFAANIQVFDLKANTSHSVFPYPMYPAMQLCWVDLGQPQV